MRPPAALISRTCLLLLAAVAGCSGPQEKPAAPEQPGAPDGPAEHQGSRRLVSPEANGTVVLDARDASVHGATLRYEPKPEKNTLGYWTDAGDWASWDFEITAPGKFEVDILQGCGTGSGRSEVEFSAGGQTLSIIVLETGGFQNFISRGIGTLVLDRAGRHTLSVKPRSKPGLAVMDLRQVTLKPAQR